MSEFVNFSLNKNGNVIVNEKSNFAIDSVANFQWEIPTDCKGSQLTIEVSGISILSVSKNISIED